MYHTQLGVLLRETLAEWWGDGAPRLAAALAFYTLFSFAPTLVIAIGVASMVFGEEAARGEIVAQIRGLVGDDGAKVIQTVLAYSRERSYFATVMGIAAALFGATAVFVALQDALNTVWGVMAKPGNEIKNFFKRRLVSFLMVLGIGVLLFASLVVSAGVSIVGAWFGGLASYLLQSIQFIFSFCLTTLLFGVIFKTLPDVRIAWKDVWVGAAATSLLFTIGKTLIGLYLGTSSIGSAYGAAGSFVILLVWVYYSAQVFFLGAEFTQVWARRHGSRILPDENAVRFAKVIQDRPVLVGPR